MIEMTKGEFLEIMTSCAGDYYKKALKSVERNKYVNKLNKADLKIIKSMPEVSQKLAEAIIVDFINFMAVQFGGNYGLHTKHLPEEFEKNEKERNKKKCPECGSTNIEPVHPFDYVKECKDCSHQFSTGEHN